MFSRTVLRSDHLAIAVNGSAARFGSVFGGPSVGRQLAAMTPESLAVLKTRMRAHLPADAAGRITYSARANAVKGRVAD